MSVERYKYDPELAKDVEIHDLRARLAQAEKEREVRELSHQDELRNERRMSDRHEKDLAAARQERDEARSRGQEEQAMAGAVAYDAMKQRAERAEADLRKVAEAAVALAYEEFPHGYDDAFRAALVDRALLASPSPGDDLRAEVERLKAELAALRVPCRVCGVQGCYAHSEEREEYGMRVAEAVREACCSADDWNGNTVDDLRDPIRNLDLSALVKETP